MAQEVAIKITADGRAVVVAAKQAGDALQDLSAQTGKTATALQGADRASDGVNAALREMDKTGRAAGEGMAQYQAGLLGASTGAQLLATAASALVGALGVREFVQAADAVTSLQNQLKLATGSAFAAGQAYAALFDIAQQSRVSFTELGGTFAAISRAGQELGLSQARLLNVTEAIGNAMTISGGSAENMNAALLQLAQGLASGMLRGEELNSVMEQTPRLARALADGLGVSTGQLREMGAAGQITAEQVIKALESQSSVLKGEVAGATLTVGQAFTVMGNAATKAVGEFDRVTGASGTLAAAIKGTSDAVSVLGKAFADNETVVLTTLGVLGGAAVVAGVGAMATAMGGVAGGIALVSGAFGTLTAVMAANPVGLALLGIGAAVGGFMAYNSAHAKTADGIRATIRELESLNKAPSIYARDAEGIEAWRKASAERREEIAKLRATLATMDTAGNESGAETARLGRQSEAAASAARSNAQLGSSLDDLRARLSGFRGDYAQYQADLKSIQAGMDSGRISQAEGIAMLTELAKKHGEVAKAAVAGARGTSEAEKALIEEQKRSADVVALRNKLVGEGFDAQQKLQQAAQAAQAAYATDLAQYTSSATSAQQRLQDLTDQAEAVAYAQRYQVSMAVAVKQTTIARLKEKQVAAMGNEAAVLALQAEIEARQKIIGVLSGNEAREAGDAARKSQLDAWNNTWAQVADGFTDALMQGGQSVKQYLIDLFRKMVLRPLLAPIGSGFAGMLSGPAAAGQGAGAAGGGGMDSLGTLSGLAGLSSAFGTGMAASFNSAMAAGVGGWATAAGSGSAAGMAAGAGMVAAPLAAIYAGFELSKAIAGDYRLGGLSKDANALFGGLPARMFGRKLDNSGFQGEFGGAAGFEGENFEFYKGGWFRSDKTKTSAMDSGMQTALATQYAALQSASAAQAEALGLSASALDDYTRAVKISTKGLSDEQITQKLTEEFAAMGDEMAALLLGTEAYTRTGETAAEAMARLSTSLTTVNQISDTLGWALEAVSLAGGAAASEFAELFGGLEGLAQSTSSYYEAYYTEAERTATTTRQLSTELAALGVALPASRDAYRRLVEDARASGDDALVARLLKLSPVFAGIAASADDLASQAAQAAQEVASAAADLRSAFAGLLQPLLDAVASARQQVAASMGAVAGLPGPTLQQLRDQVAAQQVTLPSAAGVLGVKTAADAAYQQLAAQKTTTDATALLAANSAAQANSAAAALEAKTAAFNETKANIVTAEAAENAAFARLGFAYGGGFTVDAAGKPVWSNTEKNGQATWATNGWQQQDALAAMRGGTGGQWGAWLREGAAMPTQDPTAPWNRLDALGKQYGIDKTAQAQAAVSKATADALKASTAAQLATATTAQAQAQAAVDAAVAAQTQAQADYAAALRGYVADASKAVDKLGDLREQTVAYYEAQKQLADGMLSSAQSLRDAAQAMRYAQLSPAQSLAQQRQQFDRQYALALSTTGMVQAGYADQLAQGLPALSESLKAQSASRADWVAATAQLFAQSQAVAAALEANAPKNYQAESLAVLGQIDGTLEAIGAATSSAEKIISDAIFESGGQTLAGLRGVVAAINGETVPAFAVGGTHIGGLRLVGERGPELEATGPARIYSASQTRALLAGGGDDGALVAELQALRAEMQALRAEARATAINTGRSQDLWKRVTRNGEAMQTEALA